MKIAVPVPSNFNFWRTVFSHGWYALPPFRVSKEEGFVRLVPRLSTGRVTGVTISSPATRQLIAVTENRVSSPEREELTAIVRTCFRLDEDLSEFYRGARKHRRFRWVSSMGAGRLLRAPTVFEDIVKMICTTNCSWALTEIMVGNLCSKLGGNGDAKESTFPSPEAIAGCSEKYIRREIRAGYRAPYLLEFSRRVAKNQIDPERWRSIQPPTAELFAEVRSIKGVGDYAAGNILKLLGRYEYLGIDSWCRKQFSLLHRKGRKASDKVIEKFYAPFGKWQGLFFWMDVTKHWHTGKTPF